MPSALVRPILQESKAPEASEKAWSKEDTPLVEEDQVRQCLSKLGTSKSMGPDGMHSCLLRVLVHVIVGPFSVIFEQSWQAGEISEHWRKANVSPIFKKGNNDPGT